MPTSRRRARTIAGQVLRTPMLPAPKLSALTGAEVFVKYENLQVTNSFKERGALNKLASLTPAERARGVIAMSAGNHAQAVAYHARRLGIPATIVMPVTTPFVKVEATQRLWRRGRARRRDHRRGAGARRGDRRASAASTWCTLTTIALVIAGQGTIALEMLEDVPDLDMLVVPIGGGGLIAGNRDRGARGMRPAIEMVGAEAALYPSFWNALHGEHAADRRPDAGRGHRGEERRQADAADRARAGRRDRAGRRGASRARGQCLSHAAEDDGGGRGRRRARGDAGSSPSGFRGRKVGLILCGGNIDPRILASVMVRELEREDRIVSFRLTIPDRPGVLGQIATRLGELGANILEVDHRRLFLDVPAKGAKLDVTVETRDRAHAERFCGARRRAATSRRGSRPRSTME